MHLSFISKRAARVAFLALSMISFCGAALSAAEYNIVTGAETGTYIQIGKDLSKFVTPAAGIKLNVLTTAGSVENIKRLRDEAGTKLALVQSDVFQAFLDEAANGNPQAARIVAPLRVVVPLYQEEVYAVVRADSPLKYLHEIHGKRINVGPVGSGSAMTAATLYRRMFFSQIPPENLVALPHEAALDKLAKGAIDVAILVAGQPANILADMPAKEARQFRLLAFNAAGAGASAVQQVYETAKIRASNYPNWLSSDVDSVAVRNLLVTYEYRTEETKEMLTRFARSMCRSLTQLQASGHGKWKEVSLTPASLKENWTYFAPTEQELRNCKNGEMTTPAPVSANCTQQEQVLGVCRRQ
jgi:TRAP transporter TAXI family solute receptor